MPRKYLSNRDRILLHLSSFTGEVGYYNAPRQLTQEGIAEMVGIGRNNVPREIKKLIAEGLVDSRKARVSGLRNKRNVYFLTPAGVKRAREIRENLESVLVTVITEEGTEELCPLRAVPEKYGVNFISAALNLSKEKSLDLISVKRERANVHYIEENTIIGSFYGRKAEIAFLKDWLKSDRRILVVQGISGIGKTHLMLKFIKNYAKNRNVFFIKISKNDTTLDLTYRLGKFYARLGNPTLERYMRAVIKSVGKYNHCENLRHIIKNSLRDEILIFDNVENATPEVKSAIKWFVALTAEKKRFRVAIIGTNVRGLIPPGRLHESMELKVDEMSLEDSVKFLTGMGIDEFRARSFAEKYGGNPIILSLAKNNEEANIRRYIFDEVLCNLSERERRAVEYLSVFERPVEKGAFLRYGMDYDILYSLLSKNIVREQEYEIYSLPTMIKRFVYERLSHDKKSMYHLMAGEYYEYKHDFLNSVYHFIRGGDTLRAMSIMEEQYHRYIYRNPGFLKQLANELVDKAMDSGMPGGVLYGILGELDLLEGNWDAAKEHFYMAMMEYEEKDASLWAKYSVKLATLLGKRGKIDESMDIARRVIERENMIRKKEHVAMAHYVMGNTLRIRGKLDEASLHFEKAVRIAEKVHNMSTLGYAYNGMGILLHARGDIKGAMDFFVRAKEAFTIAGDREGIIKTLRNIGHMHYSLRDPACEAYLKEALENAKSIGDRYNMGLIYRDLASWHMSQEHMDEAFELLMKSKQILESINPAEDLAWLYNTLGVYYGYMGNREEATRYFERAAALAEAEGHEELLKIVRRCTRKYGEDENTEIIKIRSAGK